MAHNSNLLNIAFAMRSAHLDLDYMMRMIPEHSAAMVEEPAQAAALFALADRLDTQASAVRFALGCVMDSIRELSADADRVT